MWALKLLVVLIATYAAVVLIAYAAQTSLLFPTRLVDGASQLPPGAEQLSFNSQDGGRLQGVRFPPTAGSDEGKTVVIGFGGNAWNAEHLAAYLHELFPAAEIVAFHYRGYRPSTGRPSAGALLQDAPLVYDYAVDAGEQATVIAVGFSIGSAVAVHLASERPLDGLILVTPFDSLEQLARERYQWLPVKLLLRHHMEPVEELRDVTAPVAIITAERDSIIPERRTAPLRNAARDLILDQTIRGAGHNHIYSNPEFAQAMRRATQFMTDRAQADRAKQLDT